MRPFGLAFAPAPPVAGLTSLPKITRRLILQKARRHPSRGLRPAGSGRFQDLFHSPQRGAFHRSLTVLVHYRSPAVFSLGPWSAQLPTGCLVSGGTHGRSAPPDAARRLRGSHPLRLAVPVRFRCTAPIRGEGETAPSLSVVLPRSSSAGLLVRLNGLGSSRFARRYSGNPFFSSGY
jgi:hypothetical protein